MKILMINGSRRKKNTYKLLTEIQKILTAKGHESEILHLHDYELRDCVGCELCVTGKACLLPDDLSGLMGKIEESDGVVFASPVYMSGVTSKMKTLFDRTNRWVHKPETAGKPMLCVATTAVSGLPETQRFFELYIPGIGARNGGFISRSGKNTAKPVDERELTRFLSLLAKGKQAYRPKMNEIVMFNVGRAMASLSSGDDKRFWTEKNWLDKTFYYKCKMGFLKKFFSRFLFKVISKTLKKQRPAA